MPSKASLLDTLRADAAALVESELPTPNAVLPLFAALVARLEGHLPQLAEKSLSELTGIQPDPAAVPGAAEAPTPAAPAAAGEPAIGSFAAEQAAADPAAAAPAAASADAAAGAAAESTITTDEAKAAPDTDLDRELADATAKVRQLEAQRDAEAAQAPKVSS